MYQLKWSAALGIARTFTGVVCFDPAYQIRRNAGIQASIGAPQDIDCPMHIIFSLLIVQSRTIKVKGL